MQLALVPSHFDLAPRLNWQGLRQGLLQLVHLCLLAVAGALGSALEALPVLSPQHQQLWDAVPGHLQSFELVSMSQLMFFRA